MPEVEERTMLAWLCTQLPELCVAADRDGWRGRLDREIAAVRAGVPRYGPAVASACPSTKTQQKSPELASLAALQPPGQADRQGRQPVCALDGTPMPVRPQP